MTLARCRVLPTRGCPLQYGEAGCAAAPCARYEVEDGPALRAVWARDYELRHPADETSPGVDLEGPPLA